jgi:hypothetical protein
MTNSRIAMKVNRSSFGTASARAARRSVPRSTAMKIVARSKAVRRASEARRTNSGG